MTISHDELRKARVTERGIAALLAVVGVVLTVFIDRHGLTTGRFFTGLGLIALSVGIWLHWRWARWMGLGACFLAIVVACVLPVLQFLVLPFRGFDGALRMTLLWTAASVALGALGYRGLSYFRSELGRLNYAGEKPAAQHALLGETSVAVANSAIVWVLLLTFAWLNGLGAPTWLFWHIRAEEQARFAAQPVEPTFFEVMRDPVRLAGNDAAYVKYRVLPDLIPLGLCYRDVEVGRVIDMVFANVGAGRGYRTFRYSSRRFFSEPPQRQRIELNAPDPDALLTVRYSRDDVGLAGFVYVDLDSANEMVESDESNNSARFTIHRNGDGSLALPACDAVSLRIVAQSGSAKSPATTAPTPTLPDLMPLGLCAWGQVLVGVQFTNRGAHGAGMFQVSQGHTASDLKVADANYFKVPPPYEAKVFSVGPISLVIGKRGQSADITIKLDDADAIPELNELNNITSAHVTRLPDGKLDLPQCDALAARAAEEDWEDENTILQPAFVPLPDLWAMGVCFRESTMAFEAMLGNAGAVSNVRAFTVKVADGINRNESTVRSNELAPGRVMTRPFYFDGIDETPVVIRIGSIPGEAELKRTNNTKSIDVRRLPDGSYNVPECAAVGASISEWLRSRPAKGS